MKYIISFYCLLYFSFFTLAQSHNVQLKDLSPNSENFMFPVVVYPNDKQVEKKINTILQLENLEHLPNVYKNNPFELVDFHSFLKRSTRMFYNYLLYHSPQNILSIEIHGESCGAYCEEYNKYYNFDLKTGKKLVANDLFSQEGQEEINKTLIQYKTKQIQDFLKQNESMVNNEDGYIEEQNMMYKECLEATIGENPLDYAAFFFNKDSVYFNIGRCSNHTMRALDDLGEFQIKIPLKDIRNYLTAYGNQLIFNEIKKDQSQPSVEGQFYKGFIGNYPIKAYIQEIYADHSIKILYWYESKKTPIEWSGTLTGLRLELKEEFFNEKTDNWETTGVVTAEFQDSNTIKGTWKKPKTGEELPLELKSF